METVYNFNCSKTKIIEQLVDNDEVMINHIILNRGEALPEHNSNSNVYLIIIRGTLFIKLADKQTKQYKAGSIINVPYDIKMNISNNNEEQLEFFVIKAPSPRMI
ncbi:cupin domain-containing protein [Erysipelotrichaceae bacterium OttesenSCG-928-M19]|nr:cupin domain-containing protein [Erysipelotrichaceae bacterium OttesenSCG-928-M19]